MTQTWKRIAGLTIVAGLALSACGGAPTETSAPASSSILISGSSTVEPISALVAKNFLTANPGIGITVEGPGTGDGFKRFCAGETDISDASRAIKEEEAAACKSAGIDFVELPVAYDGISVLTSPDNTDITCLDLGDLYALLGPESEGFTTWADANTLASELKAADLGGAHSPYPATELVITAPGEESSTYDAFIELALADVIEARGAEAFTRADYTASANDNVIVENIGGNQNSLGWVGYAFYEENANVVKAIEVDGGSGCTAPDDGTIKDGSYPLSRTLFIYVSRTKLAEKPELGQFVDFYLSDEGLSAVSETGYVDLPPELIDASRTAWQGA